MASDGRPVWLRVFFVALPMVLVRALELSAIAWALAFSTSSDVRAAAGALALRLGGEFALISYLMLRHALWRDPEASALWVLPAMAKRWRLITVANNVGPGLCIGLMARHPLPTAFAAQLLMYMRWRLSNRSYPSQARALVAWRKYYKRFLLELAVLCIGAVIGSLLRLWMA